MAYVIPNAYILKQKSFDECFNDNNLRRIKAKVL